MFKYGFWFWQDCGEEVGMGQIRLVTKKLKTEEDLMNYSAKFIAKEYTNDELQWSLEILEDFNGKSILFMNCHHSLSDAMGVLTLLSYINTKATHYSIPIISEPNIVVKIMVYLLSPFFILKHLFEAENQTASLEDHPFRIKNISREKTLLKSKTYQFADL